MVTRLQPLSLLAFTWVGMLAKYTHDVTWDSEVKSIDHAMSRKASHFLEI